MPDWFLDTDGDGKYDTAVVADTEGVYTQSGGYRERHQDLNSDDPAARQNQIESVARSLAATNNWTAGSGDAGASLGGTSGTHDPMGDKFTFTDGEFDPTSEEFRTSVTETGGFEELAVEFGFEGTDFEEFYDAPLGFWEQEYGEEGTLEKGRDLKIDEFDLQRKELGLTREGFQYDKEGLAESLRAATESYDIGRRRTGMLAGQSLFDIKQQTEQAAGRSGLATAGGIAATGARARKGVFQDYTLQQRELASGMAGAKSAFDIGTGRIDIAERGADITGERIDLGVSGVDLSKTQADIDWKRNISDFWKKTEDEFYGVAGGLEGL